MAKNSLTEELNLLRENILRDVEKRGNPVVSKRIHFSEESEREVGNFIEEFYRLVEMSEKYPLGPILSYSNL